MVIAIVRLALLGHVYLSADLALIHLGTHSALHFQQFLGPFDRFGWHHPGPAYFYVLAAVQLVFRDSGRSEYIGAVLINLACVVGTILILRRYAGRWAALCAAVVLGALALTLTQTIPNVDEPLGILVGPWNPNVVVFPMILFGTLCAAGATGSWGALIGASFVGTFAIQTDIGTLPVVGVFALGSAVCLIIRVRRTPRGYPWRLLALGAAGTLILWIPPIIQQIRSSPGNLVLLWRFFTAPHPHYGLASSFKSVMSADEYLTGVPHQPPITALPPLSTLHAWIVLMILVVVATLGIIMGIRRGRLLATTLAIASLLGLAVSVYAATHIVGLVFPYLLEWEIAIPILSIIGLAIALLRVQPRISAKIVLGIAALALLATSSIVMVRLPVAEASSLQVETAWHIIAPHLRHDVGKGVFVDINGNGDRSTLWGLLDELQTHGFQARTSFLWRPVVGLGNVSNHEPIYVYLDLPSPTAKDLPGFVGTIGTADIVITRSPV